MKNLQNLSDKEKDYIRYCAIKIRCSTEKIRAIVGCNFTTTKEVFDNAEEMHKEAKERGLFDEPEQKAEGIGKGINISGTPF